MPYINRRTGQVIQGPQQQAPQQASGGFNPLSGVRQGLNLGGKFLGGTGGSMLGGLGSLAGLGLGIANKNPGGIVSSLGSFAGFGAPLAQGLGLGTVGSTLGGSLAAGGSALANTLTGGAIGTAGNIVGAGAGAVGTGLAGGLGAIAGPLGLVGGIQGLLSLMGALKTGPSAKDIKEDRRLISDAWQNRVLPNLQAGRPIAFNDLKMVAGVINEEPTIGGLNLGGKQVGGFKLKAGGVSTNVFKYIKSFIDKGQTPPMSDENTFVTPPWKILIKDAGNGANTQIAGQSFTTPISMSVEQFSTMLDREEQRSNEARREQQQEAKSRKRDERRERKD